MRMKYLPAHLGVGLLISARAMSHFIEGLLEAEVAATLLTL